jgi:hypothetical protein
MADSTREPTRAKPRWVKVFVIVTVIAVVLGVVIFLVSGGQHGPGRHLPGGSSGETSPPGVTEDGGHTPPPGIDHGG